MRKEITLYITDLDGTILKPDETLSPFTISSLNALIESGVMFTYATARSFSTASKVTDGLNINLPVVVYNGAFIFDPIKRQYTHSSCFDQSEVQSIQALFTKHSISPMVFSFLAEGERFSYHTPTINCYIKEHLRQREGDYRHNPLTDIHSLYDGKVFLVVAIGKKEELLPVYEQLKDKMRCLFQQDLYGEGYWLEILPNCATKAEAIKLLKRQLEVDKIVCFGDGLNDLQMFELCDESYAVSNAIDQLKAVATKVIDSNQEDGVAKWLLKNAKTIK